VDFVIEVQAVHRSVSGFLRVVVAVSANARVDAAADPGGGGRDELLFNSSGHVSFYLGVESRVGNRQAQNVLFLKISVPFKNFSKNWKAASKDSIVNACSPGGRWTTSRVAAPARFERRLRYFRGNGRLPRCWHPDIIALAPTA